MCGLGSVGTARFVVGVGVVLSDFGCFGSVVGVGCDDAGFFVRSLAVAALVVAGVVVVPLVLVVLGWCSAGSSCCLWLFWGWVVEEVVSSDE